MPCSICGRLDFFVVKFAKSVYEKTAAKYLDMCGDCLEVCHDRWESIKKALEAEKK